MINDRIDFSADVLDIRNIIARYEELEAELAPKVMAVLNLSDEQWDSLGTDEQRKKIIPGATDEDDDLGEFKKLHEVLDELSGGGGDEQWEGEWYPVTLINDEHFVDYCEELVNDIGGLPTDLPIYIRNNIDWEGVADDLRVDYTSAEFSGNTFLWR